MGERIPLPIPLGFYQAISPALASSTCVNWLPIIPEAAALNDRALIQREGLKQFGTTNTEPCRGSHDLADTPFFVNGNSLKCSFKPFISSKQLSHILFNTCINLYPVDLLS